MSRHASSEQWSTLCLLVYIKLAIFFIVSAGSMSCADSGFVGTNKTRGSQPIEVAGSSGNTTISNSNGHDGVDGESLEHDELSQKNIADEDDPSTSSGSSDSNSEDSNDGDEDEDDEDLSISEAEKLKLQTECWFAVSGTWIGHPGVRSRYNDTFPHTYSGNEIGHGEMFDNVGGVFLGASDEPYEYGDGEIDEAVDLTFDSILIAPGMHAVIKDSTGNVLFEGDGPLIGASQYYEDQGKFRGKYFAALSTRSDIPEWMQDYLADHSEVQSIPLHAARSVTVSTVERSKCEKAFE